MSKLAAPSISASVLSDDMIDFCSFSVGEDEISEQYQCICAINPHERHLDLVDLLTLDLLIEKE